MTESIPLGSYNARTSTLREVARTFVPPEQYWSLMEPHHVLLVGPRGSGKTTMLRMLESPALELWRHDRASEVRRRVTYSGVFVPADRSWGAQVRQIERALGAETEFGLAAFTLHALRALTTSALERTRPAALPEAAHGRVSLSSREIEPLARDAAKLWLADGPVGSLEALRFALSDQIAALGKLARRAVRRGTNDAREALLGSKLLDLDFISAAVPFIERFNAIVGQEDGVWAFLFDELEFLPISVRSEIYRALRGSDPRLLFKVSLAPHGDEATSDIKAGVASGHDFRLLTLTYAAKETGYGFSEALLERQMADRGVSGSAEELLGIGGFERDAETWGEQGHSYGRSSEAIAAFADLAARDRTFAEYLVHHGVDLADVDEMPSDRRAAVLRKVAPLVGIRNAVLARSGRRRSRKSLSEFYSGTHSLFAMVEGNPRWLKAVSSRLLAGYDGGSISRSSQARVLLEAAREYRAHLRSVEYPGSASLAGERSPLRVLEKLGRYFQGRVVGDPFDPDPPLTFVVDQEAADDLVITVRLLVGFGAIVHVPQGPADDATGDVRGERFRLAYLFAPLYQLPLRLGRPVNLSTIIESNRERGEDDQMRLDPS